MTSFNKILNTYKSGGFDAVKSKIKARLSSYGLSRSYSYASFYKATKPTESELIKQSKKRFSHPPVFAIIICLYKTKPEYLNALADSLKGQSYQKFKLFLVDASPKTHSGKTALTDLVASYDDDRIQYTILEKNRTISENTNIAVMQALSDKTVTHICLVDHDDILERNALYEFASAINHDKKIKILYSDEDKTDEKGKKFFDPNFKPDYNQFLLENNNYINHLFAVEKQLAKKLVKKYGVFERKEYNGAQDYDLYLRLVSMADQSEIVHVPKVLYHWRQAKESTASNSANKLYAFESGKNALASYFKEQNVRVKSIKNSPILGTYDIKFATFPEEKLNYPDPLISVIIPNKDHLEDLEKAIKSLRSGTYKNLEFIIIENNSNHPETFAYYKKNESEKNITIVKYEGGFNYSKICNYGVKFAKGNFLLFLNNDIEMIEKDSLRDMLSLLNRKNVGAVGAKLLFPDYTIQHAGVVIGLKGVADHVFRGEKDSRDYYGVYQNRNNTIASYSAVTAACLLTERSYFDELNGFDEKFPVDYNDVDFCLRLRQKGHQIVFDPRAVFYHYESKSRGHKKSPEAYKEYEKAVDLFKKRWGGILKKGDPFYNPNLTLEKYDCSVRHPNNTGTHT